MKFSEVITALRKERNLRQGDLALQLGVSVSTVSNYETGVHYPDVEVLLKMSHYFNVSTDYLFGQTTLRRRLDSYSRKLPGGASVGQLFDYIDTLSDDDIDKVMEMVELLKIGTD